MEFVKHVNELTLHMLLSDPPIHCQLECDVARALSFLAEADNESFVKVFDFRSYYKQDYHCIDGFPQEAMPAVVVLPQPMRGDYTY